MSESTDDRDDAEFEVLTCAAVYLLQSDGTCHSCKQATPMFGLMALPPFSQDGGACPIDDDECMFREVVDVPEELAAVIRERAGQCFRPNFSSTTDLTYWMNHCKNCDAKQGDFFVHGPDGPFWPYDEAQMDAIHATEHIGPFRFVDPHTAYSGAMVDWRDRRHGVQRSMPASTAKRKKRKPKAAT